VHSMGLLAPNLHEAGVTERSRSFSFKKPSCATFADGLPESVIGKRLRSGPAFAIYAGSSFTAEAPTFVFCAGLLCGMDVATKMSNATTSATAPIMTSRFC
jgi:hypothetical protein